MFVTLKDIFSRGSIYLSGILLVTCLLAVAGCVTVNDETVAQMRTWYLCRLAGPGAMTLASEDAAIRRELEKRGKKCFGGHVAYVSPEERREQEKKKAEQGASSGSGVIINEDGFVLTNAHVAGHCRRLDVVRRRTRTTAKLIANDPINDLAVVKIDAKTPEFARFRSAPGVRLAETVMVLGYPLPDILSEDLHATSGEVTAFAGLGGDTRFLQISAPIQPGNSGGPIVDRSGLIVGIATAKLSEVEMVRSTGEMPQNVNFGLKTSAVFTLLDSHGVKYFTAAPSRRLSNPDIAEKSGAAVVAILCNQD